MPEEVRQKISDSLKGHPPNSGSFQKGVKLNLGKKFPQMQGELNPRWSGRLEKKCKGCETIMSLARWEQKRVYCSNKCDKQLRLRKRIERNTKPCEVCKKLFSAPQPNARMCSAKCRGMYLAEKFKGRQGYRPKDSYKKGPENPNWKGGKIDRTCKNCFKVFKVYPSDIKPTESEPNPASFCSQKCKGLAFRGANSPVWNGGLMTVTTYLREKLHKMPEHKEWHAAILRRDGWKCVFCGVASNGKNLEVDHIKSVTAILKEYGITTTEQARDCSALWDTENGRSLCKKCHRKTDTFGRQKSEN